MIVTYKTNGTPTTKSLTEWFFGKKFVRELTESAIKIHNNEGGTEFRFWQNGTGYMTVVIH